AAGRPARRRHPAARRDRGGAARPAETDARGGRAGRTRPGRPGGDAGPLAGPDHPREGAETGRAGRRPDRPAADPHARPGAGAGGAVGVRAAARADRPMRLSTGDRVELADLVARYALHVDRRDLAALAGLFTDDAVLVLPDPPERMGPVLVHRGW